MKDLVLDRVRDWPDNVSEPRLLTIPGHQIRVWGPSREPVAVRPEEPCAG